MNFLKCFNGAVPPSNIQVLRIEQKKCESFEMFNNKNNKPLEALISNKHLEDISKPSIFCCLVIIQQHRKCFT